MTKTLLRLSIILLILGLFLGSAHAAPPQPYLVKDIYQAGDSSPSGLTAVDRTLFFRADDGTTGEELWTSDGTTAGTVLVKDIHPAGDSSPHNLTNVNGTLFFAADDGTTGIELWALLVMQKLYLPLVMRDS